MTIPSTVCGSLAAQLEVPLAAHVCAGAPTCLDLRLDRRLVLTAATRTNARDIAVTSLCFKRRGTVFHGSESEHSQPLYVGACNSWQPAHGPGANCPHLVSPGLHRPGLPSKVVVSESCSSVSHREPSLSFKELGGKPDQWSRLIAIGIGTAGGKMVGHIADRWAQRASTEATAVESWAMNTDAQALKDTRVPRHLQLGIELTKGLGTGGDSTVGAQAAEASAAEIERVVGGRPGVCYVICGAGGGTGGGASPLVLSAARVAGHLAVAVVTLPFSFEGTRRQRQSRATLEALQTAADVVIAIDQDAFLQQRQDLSMTQAAAMAADLALHATLGITTALQVSAAHPTPHPGVSNTAVPLSGILQVLQASGRAVVGRGEAATPVQALQAALQAPGLASLHMFAGSLVCVLSSAAVLRPAEVQAARASMQALTGGHTRVLLAARQEARPLGTPAVGATVILTGLPCELADAPLASVSPAPPAAPPPRGHAAPASPAPKQEGVAAKHANGVSPVARGGARLPPPGGRIRVWSAGDDTGNEWPGESRTEERSDEAGLMSAGVVLEAYSSPLDQPRSAGSAVAPRTSHEAPLQGEAERRTRPERRPVRATRTQAQGGQGAQASTGIRGGPAVASRSPPAEAAIGDGSPVLTGDSTQTQPRTRVSDSQQAGSRRGARRTVEGNGEGGTQAGRRGGIAAARQDPPDTARGQGRAGRSASQLDGAAAAHAAALQWWREVVEAPADSADDATADLDQDDDCRGEALGESSEASPVSVRARAILARERHQERYRQVRGRQVLPGGGIYEGNLANSQPHGQGRCTYPNGDVYEGGWRYGAQHGAGRLSEASGDVYEGTWRDGHRHGKGRVEYASGHVLSARFVGGHVHGPAIIAFQHGVTFYGAFSFNRRQGVAVTVDANGKREWEVWDHGQRIS